MQNINVKLNPKNQINVKAMSIGHGVAMRNIIDVDLTGLANGNVLIYDSTSQTFKPGQNISSNVARTNQTNTFTADQIFSEDVQVGGDVTITGNLTVNGSSTILNSTNLSLTDKNIELARGATTDAAASGGGITLKGLTDKTLTWQSSNSSWASSENFDLAPGKTFKIDGATVLTGNSLGLNVTGSSLTSVGIIGTGTWRATAVELSYGGTGSSLTATPGAIAYSGNSGLALSAVGQSGQVFVSGGASAPSWSNSLDLSEFGISGKSTLRLTELITTSVSPNQEILNLPHGQFQSVKFFIQAKNLVTGGYQCTEIMAIHNSSTAAHVEYATISIGGNVATFDVNYSNGISLVCTPLASTQTVFRVFSTLIRV